jgi:hypothetical protein
MISLSFNAAIRNAILTDYLETTEGYVIKTGGLVKFPPATSLAFLVKSIFMSKAI